MNAKRKAAQIYDQYWSAVSRGPVCKTDELPDMRPLLEQAIIQAEEDRAKKEREACAQMCDEQASSLSGAAIDASATGDNIKAERMAAARDALRRMAREIRARS